MDDRRTPETDGLRMGLKQGYKQTEIGVIPDDWEVCSIGNVFRFLNTGSNSRSDLSNSGEYKYIHYGDIHTKWSGFLDCSDEKIPRIESTKVQHLPILKDGDLVMADASEDYEGVGVSIEIFNVTNQQIVAGLHTILLRGDETVFVDGFKGYLQEIESVKQSLQKIATGISVYGISKTNLRNIMIPVPPLKEQQAIADALCEVDAELSALDALIAKKRDIKQGAMQDLLTGQTRLSGFDGEWEVKKLGDVVEIISGGTPSTNIAEYWDGGILWCTPTDITNTSGKYIRTTNRTISVKGLQNSSAQLLPQGTLLLCSRATIGEVKIATAEISTNQGFKSLICNENALNEYLYYLILIMKNQMIEVAIGSTFLELSKTATANLEITLPEIDEQQAIATLISGIDSEISLLEAQGDKVQDIKQGMMQELLTGKTRLV